MTTPLCSLNYYPSSTLLIPVSLELFPTPIVVEGTTTSSYILFLILDRTNYYVTVVILDPSVKISPSDELVGHSP